MKLETLLFFVDAQNNQLTYPWKSTQNVINFCTAEHLFGRHRRDYPIRSSEIIMWSSQPTNDDANKLLDFDMDMECPKRWQHSRHVLTRYGETSDWILDTNNIKKSALSNKNVWILMTVSWRFLGESLAIHTLGFQPHAGIPMRFPQNLQLPSKRTRFLLTTLLLNTLITF